MRSRAASFRSFLGLNRNVAVLAASLFGLALGEELWQAYIPAYLTALGASGLIVGLFGSCKDLLDGSVYQYPGGWLAEAGILLARRSLLTVSPVAPFAQQSPWERAGLNLEIAGSKFSKQTSISATRSAAALPRVNQG